MLHVSPYTEKLMTFVHKTEGETNLLPEDTWSGKISGDISISNCPFVVFDTELTGLNPRRDSIISIGAVRMTGGIIHAGKVFYRLVKPSQQMKEKSVVIHGITPDDLEDELSLDEVMPEFLDFISDAVLMGHFAHIDLRFINQFTKRAYGFKLNNPAVDTFTIHEWLYQNTSDFKKHFNGGSIKTDLFSLAQRYGIHVNTSHNALNDAFITAQLFQRFKYFLELNGIHTLEDLIDVGRA